MDRIWFLHNNRTRVTHDLIPTEKAVLILRSEPTAELQHWFAWHEGMAGWKPCLAIDELDLTNSGSPQVNESPTEPFKVDLNLSREISSETSEIYWMTSNSDQEQPEKYSEPAPNDLSQSEASPSISNWNRRKYTRVEKRLKVIIEHDSILFRTFTKDISLGGIALDSAVPSIFLGQPSKITLSDLDGEQSHLFHGRLLANRENLSFIHFFRVAPQAIVKLESWIRDQSEYAQTG